MIMKKLMVVTTLVGLATSPLTAASSVSGAYVEARTAEVFAGGCIMGSEAETAGRQAVLAWKVDRGTVNGVSLDGLSVVAALVGDRNLGIREIGGDAASVRSQVFVDERANPVQRLALVEMASDLSNGLMGTIVNVSPAPIRFADEADQVAVTTSQVSLDVNKHVAHDPTCGAMQWFHPLGAVDGATIGVAERHSFSGSGLGTKWSDPNKRSAFFGTFTY
jgi:hypothetical protein